MAGLISLDILSPDHPSLLSTAQTPTLLSSPPPSTHLFYLLPISPLSHAMEVTLVDRAHVPEAHCQGGLGHEQLHISSSRLSTLLENPPSSSRRKN